MGPELIAPSAHYGAIRTADRTYVEYGTGERELYNLRRDPHQLDNAVDTADPALVAALSERVAALARCAAEECRRLEDLPTVPAEPPLLAKRPPDGMVIPAVATN